MFPYGVETRREVAPFLSDEGVAVRAAAVEAMGVEAMAAGAERAVGWEGEEEAMAVAARTVACQAKRTSRRHDDQHLMAARRAAKPEACALPELERGRGGVHERRRGAFLPQISVCPCHALPPWFTLCSGRCLGERSLHLFSVLHLQALPVHQVQDKVSSIQISLNSEAIKEI